MSTSGMRARQRGARRGWALALVGVLLCLGVLGCRDGATVATSPGPAGEITRPEVGFRSPQRLDEHYDKHGHEFGAISKDEYLRQAQVLRDRPAVDPVIELVRRDSVITRFDRESGSFIAFEDDGIIRTFFRPNDGERYFRRQARR